MDPMDFFPYRGQYGRSSSGAGLFIISRLSVPAAFYSLLAPPTSPYSASFLLPNIFSSFSPPSITGSIPFIPSSFLDPISTALNLSPPATLLFLGSVLSSISFTFYNTLWRRERFPLTGQGGALQVATQVQATDFFHAILFRYAASNPTWSPTLFKYYPTVFILGLGLHCLADHQKYVFRSRKENKGKVLQSGVWSVVRHPNFLGFTMWRFAFATACGGWVFGLSLLGGFVWLFTNTSFPILEEYMRKNYEKRWLEVEDKVKWKMIPGIW